MKGWIKTHRSIQEHWIFTDAEKYRAWMIILFSVNFEPKKQLIQGELIECDRGQSLFSLKTWSNKLGAKWSIQKIRTFFSLLEKDKMIRIEGLQKTTRLTVCNYDYYQEEQHTDNTQITRSQHAANTQITTTKEREELKQLKKVKKVKGKSFSQPTTEEILNYCLERKNRVDPQRFFDHYTANGWLVGKNKMKDWKAAVRTWERNEISTADNYKKNTSKSIMNAGTFDLNEKF